MSYADRFFASPLGRIIIKHPKRILPWIGSPTDEVLLMHTTGVCKGLAYVYEPRRGVCYHVGISEVHRH